jgi:hypothetical protein
MEVFDRSLTNIPIELHTNYISNFQIKYIPVPDQFVWSGRSQEDIPYHFKKGMVCQFLKHFIACPPATSVTPELVGPNR